MLPVQSLDNVDTATPRDALAVFRFLVHVAHMGTYHKVQLQPLTAAQLERICVNGVHFTRGDYG